MFKEWCAANGDWGVAEQQETQKKRQSKKRNGTRSRLFYGELLKKFGKLRGGNMATKMRKMTKTGRKQISRYHPDMDEGSDTEPFRALVADDLNESPRRALRVRARSIRPRR